MVVEMIKSSMNEEIDILKKYLKLEEEENWAECEKILSDDFHYSLNTNQVEFNNKKNFLEYFSKEFKKIKDFEVSIIEMSQGNSSIFVLFDVKGINSEGESFDNEIVVIYTFDNLKITRIKEFWS